MRETTAEIFTYVLSPFLNNRHLEFHAIIKKYIKWQRSVFDFTSGNTRITFAPIKSNSGKKKCVWLYI